ncbi:MAG TPA: hemerythrin domain-containing protein [Burkholderiales bacterium]|nr:hemerythrin domain-containing protein [Burkholderiales bacterium]
MNPNVQSGQLSAPEALRLEHDELRAQLARATMESGRTAQAAKRVAELCLPHFEQEEKLVFPLFGLLDGLTLEDGQPTPAEALPALSRFNACYDELHRDHQWITTAIATLMSAARKERNREVADLAYRLWLHERIEEAVIYPLAILIGRRVRENVARAAGTRRTSTFAGS